jgi:putative flippase GtrA
MGENDPMRGLRTVLGPTLVGSTLRYAIAGVIVGLFFLGIPLVLNDWLGVPIEVAIPFAYVAALTLHFNLQRHFVFRHVESFALGFHQQVVRYAMMAAVQYPIVAIATALVPGALDISQRVAYVIVVLTVSSVSFFLVLRKRIFHAAEAS